MNKFKNIILITCFAFAIALTFISFFSTDIEPLRYASISASAIYLAFLLYIKFLWRWKWNPFKRIRNYTNLNGKWNCHIIFDEGLTYDKGEKDAICTIKQDLLDLKIKIETNENTSISILSCINKSDMESTLIYMYKSETSKEFRAKNPDKIGSAKLKIIDENHLEGEYWTNGKSAGKLILEKRIK